MKNFLMTILRNKNTDIEKFRQTAEKIAFILAGEVASLLAVKKEKINTKFGKFVGTSIKNNLVFIPILRSGIALLIPFLKFFENAKVGFIGLKRDEKTAIANLYYKNLPKIDKTDEVIILDPMIATGGSGSETIEILKKEGIKEEKIIFVAIICSKFGIEYLKKKFSKIRIIFVQQDEKLNKKKFIVPGLGDFGDRYFGTV